MPETPITPAEAIERMAARLAPVEAEPATLARAAGRVLAGDIALDRDSPACTVSAMDGFAVRSAELAAGTLPVAGEARIGRPPADLSPGAALKIYTGSPLPRGADAVVRLEWVREEAGRITQLEGKPNAPGADVRRQGENAKAGAVVLARGVELSAAAIGALATVGPSDFCIHRRVRVSIVTTGDELETSPTQSIEPWRLRDSNGPALEALLSGLPWIKFLGRCHVGDDATLLTQTLAGKLAESDAVLLTGGVSKGAYDHVPDAVVAAGGEVVFHRMKARPGQPTLGAVAGNRAIVGLPGNPLAVLTAGRRVVVPILRRLAGLTVVDPPAPTVMLRAWSGAPLPLTWWRPVNLDEPGAAELADLRGSGDVCGPAMTDGFIEAPPGCDSAGAFPFYSWRP